MQGGGVFTDQEMTKEILKPVFSGHVISVDGWGILGDPLILNPYQSKSGHLSHTIPGNAPLGNYTYHGYVGKAGVGIINADQFEFEVIQGLAVEGSEDWETTVDQSFSE